MTDTLHAVGTLPEQHLMLAYIAGLELEVDRLRKKFYFMQHEVIQAVKQMQPLCHSQNKDASAETQSAEIQRLSKQLADVIRDVREQPSSSPAHDQVVAIAIRPLLEQVFRWQQRLLNAPQVALRLELASDYIEWFPARLRHILDNLVSNAIKYRDQDKGESRVTVQLRLSPSEYELLVSDNGIGLPSTQRDAGLDSAISFPSLDSTVLGVGFPVVKLLVEQSGGSLNAISSAGQGTGILLVLPRFDVDDFLESRPPTDQADQTIQS